MSNNQFYAWKLLHGSMTATLTFQVVVLLTWFLTNKKVEHTNISKSLNSIHEFEVNDWFADLFSVLTVENVIVNCHKICSWYHIRLNVLKHELDSFPSLSSITVGFSFIADYGKELIVGLISLMVLCVLAALIYLYCKWRNDRLDK